MYRLAVVYDTPFADRLSVVKLDSAAFVVFLLSLPVFIARLKAGHVCARLPLKPPAARFDDRQGITVSRVARAVERQ
jgi:hypothetical protein